ncbi:MAG TPA: tetratricopeptide repeat protein [Alloacidobacterium sp.]|nr:tetratricopeptide repeat protein [Alloacidobacterium sp.]
MRRLIFIPVLSFALCLPAAFAQQQKQQSDPYASPPPPPQAPATQPDKNCSGQATKGNKGPWKASSTCPQSNMADNTPALQTAPNAKQQKKSTEEDNPFPEDISEKAAAAARARDAEAAQPAPSVAAGESSSRSKQMESLDLEGDRDSRISDGAGGVIHDPKLAADDIHVGQFYLNREDYKGAYARFKEATQADPENADAVFYLAEAARHMNHRDEAVQNYQLYLAALPDGPKAKEANKALRELKASAKP